MVYKTAKKYPYIDFLVWLVNPSPTTYFFVTRSTTWVEFVCVLLTHLVVSKNYKIMHVISLRPLLKISIVITKNFLFI